MDRWMDVVEFGILDKLEYIVLQRRIAIRILNFMYTDNHFFSVGNWARGILNEVEGYYIHLVLLYQRITSNATEKKKKSQVSYWLCTFSRRFIKDKQVDLWEC